LTGRPTITATLAEFASQTRFVDLPLDVVTLAKRLILDVLGNSLGGWSTSAAKYASRTVRALGGTEQASLIAAGRRTSIPLAVFGNVILAGALEADDTTLQLGHYAHCAVLPALAVAEHTGASGPDLLAAVATAYEFGTRVALGARHVKMVDGQVQRSATGTGMNFVVFPAAVGSGRLLGLDHAQMESALGIAGNTASIPLGRRWTRPYSHAKYNPYAFMAQSGTMAALLSGDGFTGDRSIFDACGMEADWWQMSGALESAPERALAGLGETWTMREIGFKPWPSCRYTHGPINLFEVIAWAESLSAADIERVDVWSHSAVTRFHMEESSIASEADCNFSVPHAIAMAALEVPPGPRWVAPSYWHDPVVAEFKSRVHVHVDPEMDKVLLEEALTLGVRLRSPHRVRIVTRDGRTFERSAEYAPGDPQTPETAFGDAELEKKFRGFTELTLPAAAIDACIDVVGSLEQAGNVRGLIDLIA
jgi:2-methylcitrate dehydratase PrpD